ncbi:MAG: hypothetical protein KBS59_02895, partial [Clostridiales bacterium]|nr:hypothetical protein [Clostridiales bacterium]
MATNGENKNSYDEVESAAQDLLKKLSTQYDADQVKAEKKMADTLEVYSDDNPSPDRLSTQEFNRIFDQTNSDGIDETKEDKPAPEKKSEKKQAKSKKSANDDEDVKSTIASFANDSIDFSKDITFEFPSAEASDTTDAPSEEPAKEDTAADEPKDEMISEKNPDEEKAPAPETITTDIYTDRMAGEDTIESFKPIESIVKEQKPENDRIEYRFEQTVGDKASDDTNDTLMMEAFGLDPKDLKEKDDSRKIFDTYTFASTDELDAVPNMDTTGSLDLNDEEETVPDSVSYEYTDPSQKKEIIKTFRTKYVSAKVRMVVCAIMAAFLFLIEALPAFGANLDLIGNPFMTAVVDLCIMLCCSALVFGSIINALMLLTKGKFCGDTVTLASFVVSFMVSLTAVIGSYTTETTIPLYNFAFALCAFASILFEFLSLRRDIYAFKIVSSADTKTVIARLNRIDRYAEEKEFGEYMGDYSDVYKIEDTAFVSDFFRKRKEIPAHTKVLAVLIPVSIVAAVVAAVISGTVLGETNTFLCISNGFLAYWFCAPVAALISFTYPMYLSSIRAYQNSAAIIGDATPDTTSKISAIAFNDSDAFPPERIKIKSVKVFENYHIENVIYFASSVFSKVGGPLSTVFKQATLDSLNSENIEIKEITDLGIDAFVDGRHIVVGQPAYMESQCFETMYEAGDEEYEGKTNKRVLYLACDEVVVAKFYIQYNVSSDFLYIVRHLCRNGICISIRSSDPCVDNDILYRNKIDPDEYPVRIIKGQEPNVKKESISANVGAIVSTGSRKGLIKTLLLCDKLNTIKKTNLAVKIISMIIGMVAVGWIIA